VSKRFALLLVGSPLHDPAEVAAVVAPYLSGLEALGGELVERPPEAAGRPLLFLVATGGTEEAVLDLWAGSGPLLLIAHPGHNSLPASLEALAAARQQGGRGRILYLDGPGDEEGLRSALAAVEDVEAWQALGRSRLGLVGKPSDWLVASTPDAAVVRRVWGPEVIQVGMDRFLAACRAASVEGSADGGVESALRALASEERLDALTVRCFDLIGARQATACLALSVLNDEGVVAGCEGDLPSAVAMLWVRRLLGAASWMANPARLDPAAGTVTLAHCTVPRSLVTAVRLDTHFESGLGRALAGTVPTGPVTLVRIGGTGLDRLWLAEGEVVSSGAEPDLCRTQATVRLVTGRVGDLLSDPLGNHLVMVRGHQAGRLGGWWEAFIGPG
jgi:L-fucose isomerase-like protein